MKISLSFLFLGICSAFMASCSSGSEQNKRGAQGSNEVATNNTATTTAQKEEKVILFFGNSLTAGYGLDPSEAFPALIQQRLDSLGYNNYKVVNAGLSGETTAGGNQRLDWVLERQPVDVFVLELGANDGLRGVNPASTQQNLEEMIDKVRKVNPEVEIILAGMMVPPSMGQEYSRKFSQVFPEVAKKKNVKLVPFLLQDVAGERALNLGDGVHPNAKGQKILARNVWEVLKEIIEKQEG